MQETTDYLGSVSELARTLYKHAPDAVRPLKSHNNRVYRLHFGNTIADRVVKIAGPSATAPVHVRSEQTALRVLQSVGLPVPTVEFTEADAPDVLPVPFFTMPALPGEPLETTWKTKPPWEESAWRHAGRFVAELRRVPLPLVLPVARPSWDSKPEAYDTVRTSFKKHSLLRPPFTRIIDSAEALRGVDSDCFLHGDYAASQIITDGAAFGVVDWEGATTGSPLEALGRINAMTREYGGTDKHIAWTIAGFEEVELLTLDRLHELHVREMMNHVGVMSWKLGWLPDHDRHAREMVTRVELWSHIE